MLPRTKVLVVTANVREGTRFRKPEDDRTADDRRSFARRVFSRGKKVPDVLLLQETLGNARDIARALNRHPRAVRSAARYRVAVKPRARNRDSARRLLLRDSSILLNRRTVRRIHTRGVVRTRGLWRGGVTGIVEHPRAFVTVREPGKRGRRIGVASLHPAPVNIPLKIRAVTQVARVLERRTGLPGRESAIFAIGGDFNMTRCVGGTYVPERARCDVRTAHLELLDRGYRDAIRSRHLRGPRGVVGMQRRIDFLYARAPVRGSWFDRCYLPFHITRSRCGPRDGRFPNRRTFHRCQNRATMFGRPSTGCPARYYRRYYSDHQIYRATLG